MNVSTIEPTPEQLERIATFEARLRAVILEVVAIVQEINVLREAGLETREAAEAVVSVDNDALNELQTLRISRGIPAFSDWWYHRVRLLGLAAMVSDIPEDDQGEDAVLWRGKHEAVVAVDQAIAKVDPELIDLLDRATAGVAGTAMVGVSVSMQLVALIGMTEAELENRAEPVLTQLIASGWRP